MYDLLDSAPCLLFAFDDDGKIVAVNHYFAETLGYRVEELVGRRFSAILTNANRLFYQSQFLPLLQLHGKAEEVYLSFLTSSGEEVPVLVNAVRKQHGDGFLNHTAMIPVHQRKRYEDEILLAKRAAEAALKNNDQLTRAKRDLEKNAQELDRQLSRMEQKNQELARVSQVLSHDLREPIRKIAWFAEVLRDEGGQGDGGEEWLQKIGLACQRADRLLHVLREFVSLDLAEEAVERVDLNEVLMTALREVNEPGEDNSVGLESEELPVIDGFSRQLTLLFRNLLNNARKFRPADSAPRVRVSALIVDHNSYRATPGRYRYEQFVRIVVRDNTTGLGDYADGLFEPLGDSIRHSSELDFNLATCRKVVDNHHGRITANHTEGEGTVFTVLLPMRL